jgi:hypothetical protein
LGCGIRAIGTLTANESLLDEDIVIVDDRPRLGGGALKHYGILSNSSGSDFFGWVDAQGRFADLLAQPVVASITSTTTAFALPALGAALEAFGGRIAAGAGPNRVLSGARAKRVTLADDGDGPVTTVCELADGRRIVSDILVVATGVRERPHPVLGAWSHKTELSGRIVDVGSRVLAELFERTGGAPRIAVAGASHSGFSVAVLVRALAQRLGAAPVVTLLHRSPVKLYYRSAEEARAVQIPGIETPVDPHRDVCPETGNVFRYSGLRHASADLFRAVARERVPGFTLRRVEHLADAADAFDRADLVVQCLGYASNLPDIRGADGTPVAFARKDGNTVLIGPDGRLQAEDPRLAARHAIFGLGLDPYPYDDNLGSPGSLYRARGAQIRAALQARAGDAALR